jgi:hypothetical protein
MSDEALGKKYYERWTKYPFGVGSWRALFASNAAKMRIHNLYNSTDEALVLHPLAPWFVSQVIQKPYIVGNDDEFSQFWKNLYHTNVDEERYLWPGEITQKERDLIRLWAELSYWFQPLSRGAGAALIAYLGDANNEDFTDVGGDGGLLSYPSHTYLTSAPYQQVFRLWRSITRRHAQP